MTQSRPLIYEQRMHSFRTDQIDRSEYGDAGYFCERSQYQYVLPESERFVDSKRNLYVLGYAGADGIEFVLKSHEDSVYAFYPNTGELHRLASNFATFIEGRINCGVGV